MALRSRTACSGAREWANVVVEAHDCVASLVFLALFSLGCAVPPASAQSATSQTARPANSVGPTAPRPIPPAWRRPVGARPATPIRKNPSLPPDPVLYENGQVNGTGNAWTINSGFIVSDTFTLAVSATVRDFDIWLWELPGDTVTSIEWSITSQENGGFVFASGTTASVFDSFISTNQFGYNIDELTVTGLHVPLPAGTFWLNLQNATVPTGDPVYWDENNGAGCGSPGCPSQASTNSVGVIPSETFDITGTPSTVTITTLAVAPPPPAEAGQVVTLTAAVFGNGPVTAGTVTFLSGKQALGTVQLVRNGPAEGTATLKTRFAPGAYSLSAQFNGTNPFQPSTSAAQPYTVTGTEPTISTLSITPDGNNYDFTLSVFGFGFPQLSGSATLNNLTQGGALLGNIDLAGPGKQGFLTQSVPMFQPSYGVAVADFNGDGIPDIVVTNAGGVNVVSVRLGNGDGTFQPQQDFQVGKVPTDVAVGDFNGDGIPDLVVSNNGDATVSVLLGNGGGTFQGQKTYGLDSLQPYGVVVADFDGDGIADLAIANNHDDSVSVLLGNGDGTFQMQKPYPAGVFPYGLAVADFNGDGIPDLAVTTTGSAPPSVVVLLGNGDGSFKPPKPSQVGPNPARVVAADFNGDGIPDLAVTNEGDDTISVLLGNGDGTFRAQKTYPVGHHPFGIAAADFNGDGITDLAVANATPGNSMSVLLGNGDGTFQDQQPYPAGSEAIEIVVSDFNGDGVPDIAAANMGANTVGILLGGRATPGQLNNVPVGGVGKQNIQSNFTPDGNFYAGSLSNIVQVVGNGQVPTATVVSSSQNPSSYLQPVTFTATVTGIGGGSPTGTVTFTDNGANIAGCVAVPLVQQQNGSTAMCQTANLTAGMDNILASYSGDNNFLPSEGQFGQVVNPAATTTVLTAIPPNRSNSGQLVTFTATVTGAFGGSPTGTVDFFDNKLPIPGCSGVQLTLQQNGSTATCQTAALAVGGHTIIASYHGDANFNPSGNFIPYTILAPTMTVLTVAPPSPVGAGQVVTLTATVTSGGETLMVGTVTFSNGKQVLGTVQVVRANGTATLKTRLAPGQYSFTAGFNGTSSFQSSQSAPQPYSVTGTEPTISTLSATPDGSNYDFTLSVFGFGFPPFSGMASLNNLTQGGTLLGNINLAGPGMSGFQPQMSFPVDQAPVALTVGDFNGDGIPDLAVSNGPPFLFVGNVSVLLGKGDGSFHAQKTFAIGGSPLENGIAIADFNADGNLDLAAAFQAKGPSGVSVLLGNGDGTFQPEVILPVPASALAVGDFNGDGLPDLVVATPPDMPGVAILINTGDGNFGNAQLFPAGDSPVAVAVGDFNGDGNLDVALADFLGNQAVVLLGNGDGTLQAPQTFPAGQNPSAIAVGDLNGDGKLDLVLTNQTDNTVSMLLGNGDGTFQLQQVVNVGMSPNGVVIADVNGDGIPDLVFSNSIDSTVGVLLGNGNGTFQAQQTYPAGTGPAGIAVADFNGDGVPDLATANNGSNNGSILLGGTVSTGQVMNIPVFGQGNQNVQSNFAPNGNFYAGSLSNIVPVPGRSPGDFSVLPISPGNATVTQGFSNASDPFFAQTINLTVQPLNGYKGTVSLSCSVNPPLAGGSCVVNPPNSGSLAGGNLNTTLTINAGNSTPYGPYTVTVTAQDNNTGVMHFSTLALGVIENDMPGVTMPPGGGKQTMVSFNGPPGTGVGNFSCPLVSGTGISGTEDFSRIGGVCTFSPGSTTLPGSVMVTISGCTVAQLRSSPRIFATLWLGVPGVVLLGCLRVSRVRRRKVVQVVGTLLLLLTLLTGVSCGGGSGQLTPTGNYLVLVQGTGSDGVVYSAVVPVTVTSSGQ